MVQQSSRVFRLLTLLDNVSTQATRLAAARQIGNFTKSHHRELSSLVKQNAGHKAIHRCSFHQSRIDQDESFFEYEQDRVGDKNRISEKEASLCQALSQLASSGIIDEEPGVWLPRFFASRYVPVLSTGLLKLDAALGIGGLPKGRMVEIFGNEASGKTTLALQIVKEAQRYGGYCAYFDVENCINPSFVDNLGIDSGKLLLSRPGCIENTLVMIDTLIKSKAIDVIVVDSVAALLSEVEIGNFITDSSSCTSQKMISRWLHKIHSSLIQSQTIVLLVNQVRSYPSFSHGNIKMNEVSCGGNALKFYSAIRLKLARRGLLHTQDEVSGISVCLEVIKNKLAPAMKKADIKIRFGRGICDVSEVLELASHYNIIQSDGNGYWINNTYLTVTEAEKYLSETSNMKNKLFNILRQKMFCSRVD